MNWFLIYLWLKMDVARVILISLPILVLAIMIEIYKEDDDLKKLSKASIICVLIMIMMTFLPTRKELATMIILPKILNSEIVKEIPGDIKEVYDVGKKYLLELLDTEE